MTERSRPWGGTTVGDAGPYSADQWARVWAAMMGPTVATQGVLLSQLNILDIGAPVASPVSINTGRAFVDGVWYENDVAVSVAIPTPSLNPRIDRIVLRKDYTTQQVRITRIAGVEAASPTAPAITQVAGVTWDLPLWQLQISVAAAITGIVDERDFIGVYSPNLRAQTGYWYDEDDFLTSSKSLFASVANTNSSTGIGWVSSVGERRFIAGSGGAGQGFYGFPSDIVARPVTWKARSLVRAKTPNTNANGLVRIGWFGAAPTGAAPNPAEGIYFRQDAAGNWVAVTRTASVETATATGVAVADTYKDFEIRIRATAVVFYIEGVQVAIHTTNIPAAATDLRFYMGEGHSAAAADLSLLDADWAKFLALR